MAHGWYLVTAPIITANWLAAPGQQWTVPLGGGIGRIFKLGDQPVSANVQAYYNVERPTGASTWQLRTTLSLLFPDREQTLTRRGFQWNREAVRRTFSLRSAACDSSSDFCLARFCL